jgi:hypothetical protein
MPENLFDFFLPIVWIDASVCIKRRTTAEFPEIQKQQNELRAEEVFCAAVPELKAFRGEGFLKIKSEIGRARRMPASVSLRDSSLKALDSFLQI